MKHSNPRRTRTSLLIAGLTIAIAGLAPSAAGAGVLVASASDCDEQPLSQPFAPWLDPMSYTPLAGGSFEAGADGWALEAGAAVGTGNETYAVSGPGSRSLRLPAGASAISPPICVGLDHPTVRLFAKRAGLPTSTLAVDVLFEDAAGNEHSLQIATLGGASSWQPTVPVPILVNLLALLPGERTAVAFRFESNSGEWSVDDVYVDPRHSS